MANLDKKADLAGPGVGTYEDLEKELPIDYEPLQSPMERMKALFALKTYIEENLCKELNLQMVQVPLIVDRDSGVNDYLDRDGSRTPVEFPSGLGLDKLGLDKMLESMKSFDGSALQAFPGFSEGGFKTLAEMNAEGYRFVVKRMEEALRLPTEIATCKSPAEIFEVQAAFMDRMIDDCMQQASKVMSMAPTGMPGAAPDKSEKDG